MNELPGRGSRDYARQLQEKFELYLLGLIFTVLALAVQTAKFGAFPWADGLEIAGWVALLISGLVGLSRMEWIPVTHNVHAKQLDIEAERANLQQAADHGMRVIEVVDAPEPADIGAVIAKRAEAVTKLEAQKQVQETSIRTKYVVHKWAFVAGLCLLMGARAAGPLGQAFDALQTKPKANPAAASSPATGAAVTKP